jgi:hypothetical protein
MLMARLFTIFNVIFWLTLCSCSVHLGEAKVKDYSMTFDPFGTLPQPTPTPNKITEITEVQ